MAQHHDDGRRKRAIELLSRVERAALVKCKETKQIFTQIQRIAGQLSILCKKLDKEKTMNKERWQAYNDARAQVDKDMAYLEPDVRAEFTLPQLASDTTSEDLLDILEQDIENVRQETESDIEARKALINTFNRDLKKAKNDMPVRLSRITKFPPEADPGTTDEVLEKRRQQLERIKMRVGLQQPQPTPTPTPAPQQPQPTPTPTPAPQQPQPTPTPTPAPQQPQPVPAPRQPQPAPAPARGAHVWRQYLPGKKVGALVLAAIVLVFGVVGYLWFEGYFGPQAVTPDRDTVREESQPVADDDPITRRLQRAREQSEERLRRIREVDDFSPSALDPAQDPVVQEMERVIRESEERQKRIPAPQESDLPELSPEPPADGINPAGAVAKG